MQHKGNIYMHADIEEKPRKFVNRSDNDEKENNAIARKEMKKLMSLRG